MVIANNGPSSRATTTASSLTAAADWVDKVAGTGKYAAVDKTRMAISGWSCGGLQAYTVGNDTRFSTIGIFSSGELAAADSQAVASKITKPVFYFLGGSSDIAYANVSRIIPSLSQYYMLPTQSTPDHCGIGKYSKFSF
jgi:dienelactone hydrolase